MLSVLTLKQGVDAIFWSHRHRGHISTQKHDYTLSYLHQHRHQIPALKSTFLKNAWNGEFLCGSGLKWCQSNFLKFEILFSSYLTIQILQKSSVKIIKSMSCIFEGFLFRILVTVFTRMFIRGALSRVRLPINTA